MPHLAERRLQSFVVPWADTLLPTPTSRELEESLPTTRGDASLCLNGGIVSSGSSSPSRYQATRIHGSWCFFLARGGGLRALVGLLEANKAVQTRKLHSGKSLGGDWRGLLSLAEGRRGVNDGSSSWSLHRQESRCHLARAS